MEGNAYYEVWNSESREALVERQQMMAAAFADCKILQ
jgi:hypothetical protein